ncbi:MAG: redoxin domain-containing protein [Saccharofermentanales bacterium]|jgi:peroxiredoxin
MELIKAGDTAPLFEVEDNHEQIVRLSDLRGRKVLLSFHPLAWTSVCTDQMRSLEVNYERFQELNVVPLGFSVDSVPCKAAWATVLSIDDLRLPCDFWPHGKVAEDYGIFDAEEGISKRANILIDENGKVIWVKVYPKSQLPDLQEIFDFLQSYKA